MQVWFRRASAAHAAAPKPPPLPPIPASPVCATSPAIPLIPLHSPRPYSTFILPLHLSLYAHSPPFHPHTPSHHEQPHHCLCLCPCPTACLIHPKQEWGRPPRDRGTRVTCAPAPSAQVAAHVGASGEAGAPFSQAETHTKFAPLPREGHLKVLLNKGNRGAVHRIMVVFTPRSYYRYVCL